MSSSTRCSSIALALYEPLLATASTVRSWLLLEQPGPWGPNALMQSRMPRALARWLRARSAELGIRVVLIRRPARATDPGRHVFFAYTGPDTSWMEHSVLADPKELLDVDLAPLASGALVGLGRSDDRALYLVCTNGRRDPCCAERGQPLARALAQVAGERVWECSHIGGDRFAANLVCFPQGVYLGRVAPDRVNSVVQDYEAGLIDLELYRGRSSFDFAVQAAEDSVRRRHGLRGIGDLKLLKQDEPAPGTAQVEFAGRDGSTYRVRVRSSRAGQPRPLTCHADHLSRPRNFDVLGPDG